MISCRAIHCLKAIVALVCSTCKRNAKEGGVLGRALECVRCFLQWRVMRRVRRVMSGNNGWLQLLLSLPLGFALLQKGPHAFLLVFRAEEEVEVVPFKSQAVLERHLLRFQDGILGEFEG